MKKVSVRVIEVKDPPSLRNPFIQQGIRDTAAAIHWAGKNGHAVVYFMAKKQKVYAERLLTNVAEQAEKIERESKELLMQAEQMTMFEVAQ